MFLWLNGGVNSVGFLNFEGVGRNWIFYEERERISDIWSDGLVSFDVYSTCSNRLIINVF
jgi:hypothetical protein